MPAFACGFFSLREAVSGYAPDRAVTFFRFPERKSPKKGDPTVAVGLWQTALWCSVFGARAKLASRPAAAALRQTSRSQITKRAAHAAPKPCAPRRHPRGPRAIRVVASQLPYPRLASHRARAKRRVMVRCEASRVWCSSPPSDELSSAGLCGARVRATLNKSTILCASAL